NILHIFCVLTFYISWNIEVVLVGFNGLHRNHFTETRNFLLRIKNIGYFMDILFTESVLVTVLYKAFSGIYHKNAFSVLGIFFINYNNGCGNSRAVKQVGR